MSNFAKQIPKAVREIRLQFCQSSAASAGVRQFVQSSYPAVKASNPDLKFLIREASNVSPRAFVRFERGVESEAQLANLSDAEVGKVLSTLVNQQTGKL
ncbi:hypothetical protein L202_05586 [Cryptococcus amylolentus CBS 6039]|uniref:Ribosomal protein/NADH dehydrogenase domain-containing protein n=4 Tax=Cryptococcus TaxID=5206 RepID=A0A1E3HLN5_9TREE|nr:hypothetical protein L202_05586 [Cryptococcus amylolentus CBS 6039]XP_019028894.1 NADH dehydrogenase (ubiquinone) 1 alpha subcomplex 2 [Cryptococcus wingfieldii CBS 7118]ODO04904.1 hypothetical protein I350_05514 [Cryptococcus amylolentus CBS 6273]TYJ56231.1 hypothetical protein B9479_003076 [Cryptococcus floricola]ODN77045.1 hypothetical protein L202_05586 [Cryptococcus amylolentus CBS 6039]ODN87120.1 NADH dehydrogenase (ubiquinone) 1 alpha subcomplex 2 [Cryptococcus wingfieldii CBS 7118]